MQNADGCRTQYAARITWFSHAIGGLLSFHQTFYFEEKGWYQSRITLTGFFRPKLILIIHAVRICGTPAVRGSFLDGLWGSRSLLDGI